MGIKPIVPLQVLPRDITFPADCDTPGKQTEYLYAAQEKLRKLDNEFYAWRATGNLKMADYNKFPAKIKEKWPYKKQITEEEQLKFIVEDLNPRQDAIGQKICIVRAALKASAKWDIDVGEI